MESVRAKALFGIRASLKTMARVDWSVGQFWLTIFVLVLVPLPFGSTDLFWVAAFTILLSTAVMLNNGTALAPTQGRLLLQVLWLCGIYAAVAVIQVLPIAPTSLANPIWLRVQPLLDAPYAPRISARATIPALPIGHFFLFTTALVSGILLGASRARTMILFRAVLYSTCTYAVFGLFSQLVAPNALLWIEKVAYRGVVTATFVNHNTAATYFGTGSIVWLCHVMSHARSQNFTSVKSFIFAGLNERFLLTLIIRMLGLLACVCALIATGSRGGILCTAIGTVVATTLLLTNGERQQSRYWMKAGVSSIVALFILTLLSGGRLASQGVFDIGRWEAYRAVTTAAWRVFFFGTGAGTFHDVFPAIRSESVSISGVWEAAHSTMLEVALEMGLPIALLISAGAGLAFFWLARGTMREFGANRTVLASVTGVAALGFCHSLIDFSLQVPGYGTVFAIFLGAGVSRSLAPSSVAIPRKPQIIKTVR